MCTREFLPYCGCGGERFGASGSCPGQRYAHKGNCEGDTPLDANGLRGTGEGEATIGLGNVGLIGRSAAGGARVRQAEATTEGALGKEVIRRIVRSNIHAVRYCYDKGLAKDPELEGRVTIKFTIGPEGQVTATELKNGSVGDTDVGACIAKAALGWKFPKPTGGGNVSVTYPFVLIPG